MKESAGILLYRINNNKKLEVLLVHPGGPYFAKKQAGWWTIPKGEIAEGESKLSAALREFHEELGVVLTGEAVFLDTIKQKGGKKVHGWAMKGDLDLGKIQSNTFEIQWPPKSGEFRLFPEIDEAAWFSINEARLKINQQQAVLLNSLERFLVLADEGAS